MLTPSPLPPPSQAHTRRKSTTAGGKARGEMWGGHVQVSERLGGGGWKAQAEMQQP